METSTVLLVGSTEGLRELKSDLEQSGFCAVHYEDPIQATIALIRIRPAAAVVSLPAPGMSLTEILQAIRRSNPRAAIAVTAQEYSRSQEVAAREQGVVFFGVRPDPKSLLEVVRAALAGNGSRRSINVDER